MTIIHTGSTPHGVSADAPGSALLIAYQSVAVGRMAILSATVRPNTATFGTVGDGWAFLGDQVATGGHTSGLGAADSGQSRTGVWWKIYDGSETGNVSVPVSGAGDAAASGRASISTYDTSPHSPTWVTPIVAFGADNSHGANRSATLAAWSEAIAVGDLVHITHGSDSDAPTSATLTSPTISQTGATFGSVTLRAVVRNSGGNDCAVISVSAQVTGGPSSSAPTIGFTFTGNQCGAGIAIRLRELIPVSLDAELVSPIATASAIIETPVNLSVTGTAPMSTVSSDMGVETSLVGVSGPPMAGIVGEIEVVPLVDLVIDLTSPMPSVLAQFNVDELLIDLTVFIGPTRIRRL